MKKLKIRKTPIRRWQEIHPILHMAHDECFALEHCNCIARLCNEYMTGKFNGQDELMARCISILLDKLKDACEDIEALEKTGRN